MYRSSQASQAETVERLERELAELRALTRAPRRKARAVEIVAALGVVSSLLLGVACAASRAHTDGLERSLVRAARVLDMRASDLRTCEGLAEAQQHALATAEAPAPSR